MNSELEFSIGEVAAMLGMTPSTIRVWERRYGVLQPRRTGGGRRRYTVDDVAELHRIKVLLAAGRRSVKLAVLEGHGSVPALPPVAPAPEAAEISGMPWRAAADALPSLVVFLATTGQVIDVNVAAAEAFARSVADLSQVRFVDLVQPQDRAKAVKLYAPPLVERRGWELNLQTRPPRTYAIDSSIVASGMDRLVMLIASEADCRP
jgi:PAS domain-containing protein